MVMWNLNQESIYLLASNNVQEWLPNNLYLDLGKLLLGKPIFPKLSNQLLAMQLQSMLKAKSKLPTWFETKGIVWPHPTNLSQSSSEATALFKAGLVDAATIADITGGFGVDSWAFAKRGLQTIYVEKEANLALLAGHNFNQLKADIQVLEGDILQQFDKINQQVEWLYADPLRREDSGERHYQPEHTIPNPVWVVKKALDAGKPVMIKLSPMASLPQLLTLFPCLSDVYAVSHQHELKETLIVCKPGHNKKPALKAIQLLGNQQINMLETSETSGQSALIGTADKYLFLPDVSVLKLELTNQLANLLNYNKLHSYSHVLTGSTVVAGFPGRCFRIKAILPPNSKAIKQAIPGGKATIMIRDLHLRLEQVLQKTGLKEGGSELLLATSLSSKEWALISLGGVA